jgi:hypothetical protein
VATLLPVTCKIFSNSGRRLKSVQFWQSVGSLCVGENLHRLPRILRSQPGSQSFKLYQSELGLQSPQTFGEFQGTMDPRSMQFALRYEFWLNWIRIMRVVTTS